MPDSEPYSFTLHLLAAENGHKEVATLLLDKGAAVDAKDKWGRTPLRKGPESKTPRRLSLNSLPSNPRSALNFLT